MTRSRGCLLFAVGAIVLCGLLVAAGTIYAYNTPRSAASAPPQVEIKATQPEGLAVARQPVVVFAEARDSTGITRVELWVNGEKAATQTNPNPSSPLPFQSSPAWIPNGQGDYLMVVKAINSRGAVGESEPRPIQVGERAYAPEADSTGQYIVREGDTWESIAAALGTTVDDLRRVNPDVDELTPGTELVVPPLPEEDAEPDGSPGPSPFGDGGVPGVDPPAPAPPSGDASEAEPDSGDSLFGLPLPAGLLCLLRPELCREPADGVPAPFPRPDGVSAGEAGSGCGVDVFWYDRSENETGFRLYRFTSRPRFRMELIEMFGPSSGAGTRLHYLDPDPPGGTFSYSVVAFNAGGNTWSPLSPPITSAGCASEIEARALVVEALSMTTAAGFDRLYCYASLADSPFERVPYAAGHFIEGAGGTWNIAEHFSGSNKRAVVVDAAGPLNLQVECLGWQGAELINIGRFAASHPPEEWDGRELTGAPAGGGFSVVYRINYSFAALDESGAGDWPLVDPSLPAPFNLRRQGFWHLCRRIPGVETYPNYECTEQTEPGLAWDYAAVLPTGEPSVEAGIDFNIYMRGSRSGTPRLVGTSVQSWSFGLPPADCSEGTYYSVSAVLGEDPVTHERVQSPLSEELFIPPSCASLVVTLEPFWVYGVDDGDPCSPLLDCRNDYEAYGWITLNGQRITWNDHCDPGLFGSCMRSAPLYTLVGEATEHDWDDMWLNTGGGYQQRNTTIRLPIADGEPLILSFLLWDHDDFSDDDVWCGSRGTVLMEARSAAEWLAVDQAVSVGDPHVPALGECILRFNVRGVPGGG
jgi:LysM repeat protein